MKLLEAVTKTSGDGKSYPAGAWLYVPDRTKPSTWKLRYKEYVSGRLIVTRRQLGLAAAALSSGGFRGQKVQLPSGLVSTMKGKIRRLYTSLGVPREQWPKHIREGLDTVNETLSEGRITDLFEAIDSLQKAKATLDKEAGMIRGLPLLGPVSKNMREYPLQVMEDAARRGVYDAKPCFWDHQTSKGPRSARDLIGEITNTRYDPESQRIRGDLKIRSKFAPDVFDLAENCPGQVAPSHVVEGQVKRVDRNGQKVEVVERITKAHSVDLVVGAATVNSLTEGKETGAKIMKTLEELIEKYPDLFAGKVVVDENTHQDDDQNDNLKDLLTEVKGLRKEVKDLRDENKELKEAKAKAVQADETRGFVEEVLEDTGLSKEAKAHLKETLDGKVMTKEAVTGVVKEYITAIESHTGQKVEKTKVVLPEAEEKPVVDGKPDKGPSLTDMFRKRGGYPTVKEEEEAKKKKKD